MRFPICSSFSALLICAALSASAAFGQSLFLNKKGATNYWIEGSAPANYVLQASENLHLWADIQNDVPATYSFQFTNTGVSRRYFRLAPAPPAPPPIRVLMIGDSMTSDCCGWGQGIYGYFKPEATVVNYAQAWISTKVFLTSAEMDKMLLIEPDYVLIQFGFMDGGVDPERYTTLTEMAANLRTIVQTVRGFNGVPILVTLHSPRVWDAQGKVVQWAPWQDRNSVTKQLAAELNTYLIDLNTLSEDLLNELGPNGSTFMELWPGDNMHLTLLGGKYISQLVTKALPDGLGPYLTGIFDPPPKP